MIKIAFLINFSLIRRKKSLIFIYGSSKQLHTLSPTLKNRRDIDCHGLLSDGGDE
jgi:hypothetical protein